MREMEEVTKKKKDEEKYGKREVKWHEEGKINRMETREKNGGKGKGRIQQSPPEICLSQA